MKYSIKFVMDCVEQYACTVKAVCAEDMTAGVDLPNELVKDCRELAGNLMTQLSVLCPSLEAHGGAVICFQLSA